MVGDCWEGTPMTRYVPMQVPIVRPDADPERLCWKCGGAGVLIEADPPRGQIGVDYTECPICGGEGEL